MQRTIAFIGRSPHYSPGHVSDDAAILSAVRQQLESWYGGCLPIVGEDDMAGLPVAEAYVSMGRRPATLALLSTAECQGRLVVNASAAVTISNHRTRQMQLLEAGGIRVPPLEGSCGYWVKRADGCREHLDDVRYAADKTTAEQYADELRRRGIGEIDIRAHVEGDWVKFYGIGDTGFFRCYRKEHRHHAALDIDALHQLAAQAAALTHLEIYGGDLILCADGRGVLVDLNDWPSFSPCRAEAAVAIAQRIKEKMKLT